MRFLKGIAKFSTLDRRSIDNACIAEAKFAPSVLKSSESVSLTNTALIFVRILLKLCLELPNRTGWYESFGSTSSRLIHRISRD